MQVRVKIILQKYEMNYKIIAQSYLLNWLINDLIILTITTF